MLARDGEKNSVIYKTADGHEFIYSGGSRAWRNHNPGNLVSYEKSGLKIGKGGRFAVFASYEDGMTALKYTLTHFYSNLTLDLVFKKYAPSNDNNDPDRYIRQVRQFSGLESNQKLGDLNEEDLKKFMKAIQRVEGWIVGKIQPVPYAQQFAVKGVDEKPLPGLSYVMSFFTRSGEEKKISGKTDAEGKTAVAKSDTRTPVALKLPRPDPGQSLKGKDAKSDRNRAKQVSAAEVKAKPWYQAVFASAEDSHDERDRHVSAEPDAKAGGKVSQASGLGAPASQASATPAPKPKPSSRDDAGTVNAPIATVKQSGAVKASGTKKKSQNYVEGIVKEDGVYVTWQFDTSGGSGKVLNGLPYFIAEMSGTTGKPLVENQRVHLMRDNNIRRKVPFGKDVALYLGNDAKSRYRTVPLFKVQAEEGLTDIVIKVAETKGLKYYAEDEIPNEVKVEGTKKYFVANLFGQTWMNFSHKFTVEEAASEGNGEAAEIMLALQQIYRGDAMIANDVITLDVQKPNKKNMKVVWRRDAFGNCMSNIARVNNLDKAKNEIIPRVHPQTYKAFLIAAFELDLQQLEINSGWRPMLGSVLHRIGVGLDVGRIITGEEDRKFDRSLTQSEIEYKRIVKEKRELTAKRDRTEGETRRLNEILAVENDKAKLAVKSIRDNESSVLRSFTAKLRNNADVRQTFDPWEMDANTADNIAPTPNRLAPGNEELHRNHLHITVKDPELGH